MMTERPMKERPQFHQLPKEEAKRIHEHIDRLASTYQKHLGVDVPIYVTGSVALHRAIAPQENWIFDDMDTLVPETMNMTQFQERIECLKRACQELNGSFRVLYYAAREGGKIGMQDVWGKAICQFDQKSDQKSIIPRITTVFTDTSLTTHLQNAKPPAVMAYAAANPDQCILSDHRWFSSLSNRRLPEHSQLGSLSSAQLKYGPRGFYINQWLGDYNNEKKNEHAKNHKNEHSEDHKNEHSEDQDQLFKTIKEAQWRNAVTAKIHYNAGAAWRNLRLFQGAMITLIGLYYATMSNLNLDTILVLTFISFCLGTLIAETPSQAATLHQRAGAEYGALEREWALLSSRAKEGRVRYDWADAQAINLQRRKSEIDAKSPNAPSFWKSQVIKELAHKRDNPDP